MNKFKSKVGEKCATWNCKGRLIEDGKLCLKCSVCDRGYWKAEVVNVYEIEDCRREKT